jgi:hypothetical protein
MFQLFWELNQQRRINETQAEQRISDSKTRDTRHELDQLRQSIEKLALVNMAMWTLLQEKTNLKDEDLLNRMQELDLADGVADGRMSGQKSTGCAACGRPMSRTHDRCMYCGAETAGGRSAFEVT